MKQHKKNTFHRMGSRLAKISKGCLSQTCPFRLDDDDGMGTANLCNCAEDARGLVTQLDKELKSVGM